MNQTAILFPGQGAQAVGMGRDLAEAFPECRAVFDTANQVLGFDLAKLCFEGPLETLTLSSNTQPAIFTVSAVCWTALRAQRPDAAFEACAGLSSGEWAALCFAGAISLEDTLRVLQARGRFMQEACEEKPGGMLSVIGVPPDKLDALCAATGVEAANFNSAEQTVLSGPKDRIAEAEKRAAEFGARKAIRLNVAGAFHSALMASAARKLEAFLAGISFQAPAIPVFSNVTGQPHGEPEDIRRLMVQQVTSSVRWASCVGGLREKGVRAYVECGPGKVLAGLVKRIDKEAALHNIYDRPSLEGVLNAGLFT
ncbi:MAG: ACP S-malonyltransferase [Verrucomicrobia bacterium]|nr:ACP S-malonyltransferase [Verrucomicrobiota bacterium]